MLMAERTADGDVLAILPAELRALAEGCLAARTPVLAVPHHAGGPWRRKGSSRASTSARSNAPSGLSSGRPRVENPRSSCSARSVA